jgi:Vam6/Vps39-like protein vacuolar protein sorting-associated protein 39
MNIFPLTGYMDCYLPQVCIPKTFSRHFTHSPTDLYEARAILLGRLGRHDQALETYVYRLQDYTKAEEYVHSLIYSSSILTLTRHCKRIYRAGTETSGIFLALLKLYLQPTSQTNSNSNLLQPALQLISRHGPRLDAVETLQLLPPLVTADDIRPFLIDSLRTPVFDTRVVREISKARNDQLARRLMALQSRRVKVTDSRMLVLNISAREWINHLFFLFFQLSSMS